MKLKTTLGLLFAGILLGISTSFTSRDSYEPIFIKRADLAHSVTYSTEDRVLERPGKIYYKSPYLFINEKYKGVHIIDNSNPSSPQKVGFVAVPGCLDMAVKGTILYVDNAIDLVAFDLETKQVTQRVESVFPEPSHPHNLEYRFKDKPEDMIVVEWRVTNH